MGCTGSKYQTLSADNPAARSDAAPSPGKDAASATAESSAVEPTTPPQPTTPSAGPSTPDPAVGPPPWGAGSRNQSAMPEFEPPIAENAGDCDDDHLDHEMAAENLEEKFPPWKESDKLRPTNGWNKVGPGTFQAEPASSSSAVAPADTEAVQAVPHASKAWEPCTTFENTVIIFDWDDTLLCSSALHCCLPNQFVELEEIVETVLLMAMSLGRTIIVTNAMESWITETTRRFMPRLMPTLERLLIVYARKNWERLWPGDTFAWKREAFRELLHDELGGNMNLLVIGDSLSEIRAAEALVELLGHSALVKTVKFKALPSPTDLLGELRMIGPELSKLVEEKQSASKELYQDIPSSGLFGSNVFQGTPNWQLLDAVPSEMFMPPPGVYAHQQLWSVIPQHNAIPPAPATQITI